MFNRDSRDSGEKIESVEMDANSRKATQIMKLIEYYKELALTAQDAGEFLGRRAEVTWERGEEHMSKWIERKGDGWYQLVEFYEEGVIKLKSRLQELIQTSDRPLALNIDWEDVGILGPSFHRVL